jgi:formylglycine-generating enzyme required for sulfatase activity
MQSPQNNLIALVFCAALLFAGHAASAADKYPDFLPSQYQRYFARFVDERTLTEQMLNTVHMTSREYGRGFALIAGISKYPFMSGAGSDLAPAAEDVRKLVNYLTTYEKFDEIVVLKDNDVTEANLTYFVEHYFPARLQKFPRSRFLFAYSGHGTTVNNKGYILTAEAHDFADTLNSIPMATLRVMFQEVVDSGFHVLALINACYSGDFLRRAFGGDRHFIPKNPGAHAITAGGSNELTWHDGTIGSGSVFFEKLYAALDGRTGSDGVVTVDDLAAYLRREVQISTDQQQNPLPGDLSRDGSLGGFFFFNRRPLVEAKVLPAWDAAKGVPFGPEPNSSNTVDRSAEAWAAVKDTTSIAILEQFRTLYPGSIYAPFAAARIEELKKLQTAVVPHAVPPVASGPCGDGAVTVSLPSRLATPLSSAEECALQPKDVFKECGNCPEMVVVPAGSFTMGSPGSEKDRFPEEGPQHTVTIHKPFAVGKFSVTFDEWDACVADHGCNSYKPSDQGWGRGRRPVINVSWNDATAYAAWLSRKTGKTYRLLSEAEREYVARAGTTTPFWWGGSISPQQANYISPVLLPTANGPKGEGHRTLPVDSFDPNPWGLYQVHGNVLEWTQDCYRDRYARAPSDGSAWTTGNCDLRVQRGGAWNDFSRNLRAANRSRNDPVVRDNSFGFRLGRTLTLDL